MPRSVVAPLMAILVVAGCGGATVQPSASRPDATTATPALVEASPTSSATPTAMVDGAPASSSSAPTVRPTSKPVSMTDEERGLVLVLREDAQVNCESRRSNLPTGATEAVECLIGDGPVDRVGVIGFHHDPLAAALAYLERMDGEKVLGVAGDCLAGRQGDLSWAKPDGVEDPDEWQVSYEDRIYAAERYGCFQNESGFANFRATCGDGTYIGVLGNTTALDELSDWALRKPPGELEPGDDLVSPGICYGTLGGGLPAEDEGGQDGDVY